MTTNDHPITPPPPELVGEWLRNDGYPWDPSENATITITTNRLRNVATQAARWGADQELEACVEWIARRDWTWTSAQLRRARRPKPPSLKEEALAALAAAEGADHPVVATVLTADQHATIRRALEALPE